MNGTAVITGIGVSSPIGLDPESYWAAALSGRTGIGDVTGVETDRYPARLAGQIHDFDEAPIDKRLLPQTDRMTRLALATTEQALRDADVDPGQLAEYSMGVVTSNACGGFAFTHREFDKLWTKGPEYVSVFESFAWFYAVNTGQISIRHKMRGPSAALVGEQAGGLDAVGHARRSLRRGAALMVSGGVDSAFDPWGWLAHQSTGRVTRQRDVESGYRPFDALADGYVPGEGGAILIIEDAEAARSRGPHHVYGEIAGYAATFDPPPGSPRPPGLRRAAELAIQDSGLVPADIDVVFADAAGVPELDRAEAAAISGLFGRHAVPVTAPKSLTGRLYGGGGPLDLVAALLSIRDGVIPPTANTTDVPDEYGIDLVRAAAREQPVRSALVLARGLHGFNAAMVLRSDPTPKE